MKNQYSSQSNNKFIIQCYYHPNETISNFCVSKCCAMPLCSYCIVQHQIEHQQIENNNIPLFPSINEVIEQYLSKINLFQQQLISEEKKLEEFIDYYQNIGEEIENKLEQARLLSINCLNNFFSKIKNDLQFRFEIQNNKINQEVSISIKQLKKQQKNFIKIYNNLQNVETCIPSLIKLINSKNLNDKQDSFENKQIMFIQQQQSGFQKLQNSIMELKINETNIEQLNFYEAIQLKNAKIFENNKQFEKYFDFDNLDDHPKTNYQNSISLVSSVKETQRQSINFNENKLQKQQQLKISKLLSDNLLGYYNLNSNNSDSQLPFQQIHYNQYQNISDPRQQQNVIQYLYKDYPIFQFVQRSPLDPYIQQPIKQYNQLPQLQQYPFYEFCSIQKK